MNRKRKKSARRRARKKPPLKLYFFHEPWPEVITLGTIEPGPIDGGLWEELLWQPNKP